MAIVNVNKPDEGTTDFTDRYHSRLSIPYSSLTVANTLDVHIPIERQKRLPPDGELWIIYIHGGAWRDPMVSSRSIEPALSQLDPASIPCIAGIASINYRLSPYPFHPVNPSRPDDPSRSVVHPAHIEDVLTAIQWLQNEYGFGKNYLLAGHSCGATLALQAVMGEWEGRDDGEKKADLKSTDNFVTPIALLGVEGIYDLPLLLKSFSDPIYRSFLEAAFGTDESKWIEASPTTGRFSKSWRNGLVCVVTFSKGDTLIDEKQLDAMMKVLVRETSSRMSGKIFELTGSHDQIWFRGKELARAIRETIEFLSVNWT